MNRIRILFFAFLLLSCSKDETIVPISGPTLLPHRLVQGNMSYEISYDVSNRLAQIDLSTTYPGGTTLHSQYFLYDDEGKLIVSTTSSGWKFEYRYTGERITETYEYVNGSLSQQHRFTYDSRNRVIQTITYQDIPEEGGLIPVQKATYQYDQNDNVLENKLYYYTTGGASAVLLSTHTFSGYDSKVHTEGAFEVTAVNPQLRPFRNNPTRLEVRNGSNILGLVETYTYDYNPQGFASRKVTKSVFNGTTEEYETSYSFVEPN